MDLQNLELIGISAMGKTRLAQDIVTKTYYSIKIIRKDVLISSLQLQQVSSTIDALNLLASKKLCVFIQHTKRITHDTNYLYFVADFLSGGCK
jgi:serine/threonine protein kinase